MKLQLKNLFLYFCILIFLFTLSACSNIDNSSLKKIKINNHELKVEIADTPQLRSQGLSGRQGLPENQGMLFIFDNYTLTSFWMKDMNFAIDIIWIKDDKVLGCTKNLPAPQEGEDPVRANPPGVVNYVVEVNSGWCGENGIGAGDIARINF